MLSRAHQQLVGASRTLARKEIALASATMVQFQRGQQPGKERPELAALAGLLGLGLASAGGLRCEKNELCEAEKSVEMSNWSGTHTLTADRLCRSDLGCMQMYECACA